MRDAERENVEIVRRPQYPAFSLKHTVLEDLEDEDEETEIDPSLPKDEFTAESFTAFWKSYLMELKNDNKPAYNVMETADWRITTDFNIALTFDSSVMVLEFDKLKSDFLRKARKTLNNFHIQVEPLISAVKETKSHIKTKKEIYEEMVKVNPLIEKLRNELGLDINGDY
ncbi:MAG: hypothetical protein ACR2MS_13000 [Weeksellaceae bacterium]